MARKPMITRTIKTTVCNVLCLELTTAEPFNKEVIVPRTFTDTKKLFKKVEELVNTESVRAVHIVDTEIVETLYGQSEEDFIKNSVILDPSTRREVEE